MGWPGIFSGSESCLLENSPHSQPHSQEGRNRGRKSQTPSWSQGKGKGLGVPTPGRQGASVSWVPGDQGYAGSLAVERQRPVERTRAGPQVELASGRHLEPQQSLGTSAASPEQCPGRGGASSEEPGRENMTLRPGYWSGITCTWLSSGPRESCHHCRKSRSKACQNQQLPV